ncbi:MAG TPA: hypothetical protein DCL17_05380 [Dehalococcoidia bacterium]|nr:hypothetical protein [Dehalococcoidia bacterium]
MAQAFFMLIIPADPRAVSHSVCVPGGCGVVDQYLTFLAGHRAVIHQLFPTLRETNFLNLEPGCATNYVADFAKL